MSRPECKAFGREHIEAAKKLSCGAGITARHL